MQPSCALLFCRQKKIFYNENFFDAQNYSINNRRGVPLNAGERDELICVLTLIFFWTRGTKLSELGHISKVASPTGSDCKKWDIKGREPSWLPGLSDQELAHTAFRHGVKKAPLRYKADVIINNNHGISLKSHRKANPAVVNHTTRFGWEQACRNIRTEIAPLDEAVEKYWLLRESQMISEDVKNQDPISPFRDYKDFIVPMIEYFLFYGSGIGPSPVPAKTILSFSDPTAPEKWRLMKPNDVVSEAWPHLIFSLRNKGMPPSYPKMRAKDFSKKDSIKKWTRLWQGKYRGALHVRSDY